MSAKDFVRDNPEFHRMLVAAGLLSIPAVRSRLGLPDNYTSQQLAGDLRVFKNVDEIRYISDVKPQIVDYRPSTLLKNSSKLKGIVTAEINRISNLNPRASIVEKNKEFLDNRKKLLNELKFDNEWAIAVGDFFDKFVRTKKSLVAISEASTIEDAFNKKHKTNLVWFPKLKFLVGVPRGSVGEEKNVFGQLQNLIQARGFKRYIQGEALKAQKAGFTFKAKGKLAALATISEDSEKLTVQNFKTLNKNKIAEVNFFINGILDIIEFISNEDLQADTVAAASAQLGHVIGIQASLADPIFAELEQFALIDTSLTPDQRSEFTSFIKNIRSDIKTELNYNLKDSISADAGYKWELVAIMPESKNAQKGSAGQSAVDRLKFELPNSPAFASLTKRWLDSKGSKTPAKKMGEFFEIGFETDNWKKTKFRPTKFSTSVSVSNPKAKFYEPIRNTGQVSKKIIPVQGKEDTDATPNLASIIAVINAKLAEQLRRNMGQGSAPKRLNWRTGRFARSAELLALLPTRGKAIEATITYLRNPYDVFLPGGKLHNDLRDPEKLIGKSIRQILSEQFGVTSTIRTRLV
jgi:hypothetical protein